MHHRNKLIIFISLAAGIFTMIPASPALARQWIPNQANVVMNSLNFSITIGKEVVTCGATVAEGTLGKGSSTWTATPEFFRCGTPQVKAGSAWTATAVNGSEATLAIPKGEAAGINVALSAKCKVRVEAGPTLGASGDFEDGANGVLEPSELTITGEKVAVAGTSKECGESATTAAISANFILLNFTNQEESIGTNEPGSGVGPYWHVNGSRFESGSKQLKLQQKGPIALKAPSTLELECNGGVSEGATLEGNGTGQGQAKGRLTFTSCKVLTPAENKCILVEPITTNPLKSYLAQAATQTGIVEVFEPGQGTVIAALHFVENGKCVFKEAGAGGTITAKIIPTGVEHQEGLLAFPSIAITKVKHEGIETTLPSLKLVGAAATFSGAYGSRLQSNELFGAFET